MKRVYHPTLNAWQDVPADRVSAWTRSGWKATKPGHIVEPVTGGPASKSEPAPAKKSEPKSVKG